jgi:hypothetical protein
VNQGADLAASPRPVLLDPSSIEAIAQRVVELLGEDLSLLDAAAVARRLNRSRGWVYEHAVELGAIRLGDGERPRLGFEPAKVAAHLDACESSRRTGDGSNAVATPRKRTDQRVSIGQGADLLPIRGDFPAW